jgi:hypothetical protein
MPAAHPAFELPAVALLLARLIPSRLAVNNIVWTAGLVLQGALVWAVFRRGIARSFPGFAALVAFYPLRAALLFVLVRYLDADAYGTLQTVLESLAVLLLAWTGIELLMRLMREIGGWTPGRAAILVALIAAACGLTWVVASKLGGSAGADRLQVLGWILMLALFAAAWKGARSRNLLRIPGGFAAFAVFELAALAGRAHALTRHAPDEYIGWSYVPACGYLAVVIFWLCALVREA